MKKKTHEEFVEEMEQVNPTITILDEYINIDTHLTCKCNECGYMWKVTGRNLLKGRGCPNYRNHNDYISPRYKDFTGCKFGMLTVLERIKTDKGSSYRCICDCGNETIVETGKLTSGHTKSCGCLKKQAGDIKLQDLTGQRFGRLTVIERTDDYISPNGSHGTQWLCKCDCGNTISVRMSYLKSGHTTSCGCYARERSSEAYVKSLIGMRFGKLTVINRAQKENAEGTFWNCLCDCGNSTVVRGGELLQGKTKSCGCLRSSGELNVITYLNNKNISFEHNKTFDTLLSPKGFHLSYDFYLPQYNILCEIQGKQHAAPIKYFGGEEQFKKQQEHDKRKREYAEKNNIKLIEIWYYDFDNIEEILNKELEAMI